MASSTPETDLLDDLVRLTAMQLRRDASSQNEMILEMSRVGFAPKRIAELLGTTQGTVNTTLQNARKKKK